MTTLASDRAADLGAADPRCSTCGKTKSEHERRKLRIAGVNPHEFQPRATRFLLIGKA